MTELDDSRIVIVGASGQLGKELRTKYPGGRATDSSGLDITNLDDVLSYNWQNVDIIINAAGYTNVDGAETPEGRVAAWKVNALGTANLTKVAITKGITLVHISTEYVFDGTKSPHTESEPLSPLGVYAQTKAAGDVAACVHDKTYILRTSWVVGEGNNFVRTMTGLAERNISPTVVSDQIGRLTFTTTLVEAIDHLLRHEEPFGIYNVSNDGDAVSWADVTRSIFTELGRNYLTVTGTTTEEYFSAKPEAAARPLLSTLDLTKIKATGFIPSDWREELKNYLKKES